MLLMETIEAFAQLSDFPTNCSFLIFALLELFFPVFFPLKIWIFSDLLMIQQVSVLMITPQARW